MPRWVRKVVEAVETEPVLDLSDVVVRNTETGEERPVVIKPAGRAYRVFDSRSALVAQVNSIEEAEEEVARFPGGTYRMV